jgi:peptidoglycan hydrolase CwlO-like protein
VNQANMKRSFIKVISCILGFIVLFFVLQPTAESTLDEAQEDVERTRTEIAEFEKLLDDIENEINKRITRIEELGAELKQAQADLLDEERNMETAQVGMLESLELFVGRLRSAYMKHNISYLEVLFQAESFADIIVWWVYLTRIIENDARIITDLEREQALIEQKRADIESRIEDLDALRTKIQAEQVNLDAQREEKEKLLSESKVRLGSELAELARLSPRAEFKPVYAVVIDNLESARPHHGINEANVVYEYEVEGGITRYLALFSSFPSKVGPIRSARLHSAALALENDTSYIHAGGGVDVLRLMRNFGVRSVNEMVWDGEGFFRDRGRRAPHNLFVNLAELGVETKSEQFIMRPAYLSRRGTAINNITIQFNNRHIVSYTYDPQKEAYRKMINGERARDAEGRQINARNVIIAYVPYEIDLLLRPTAELVGEGEIDFYSMGQHFKGIWRKDDLHLPTRFYFLDGEEIERVYGQTWIHLMRAN